MVSFKNLIYKSEVDESFKLNLVHDLQYTNFSTELPPSYYFRKLSVYLQVTNYEINMPAKRK